MAISPTPHVALIVETSKAYGRDLLRGIGRYVQLHGPWATWIDERSLDDPLPKWLSRWQGHGILARSRDLRTMQRIVDLGLPTVNLGEIDMPGVPIVDVDGRAVGVLGADHLIERGFRHFGYVGMRGVVWSDRRRDAFSTQVAAAGGTCHLCEPFTAAHRGRDWEQLRDKLARWLVQLPKPIGVMACYDVMGRNVLGVCGEQGIAVPEEVAVVAVDNDQVLCDVAHPPLSSVDLSADRVGYEAAAMLDRLMRGKKVDSPVVLRPSGVVARPSTDVTPVDDADVMAALRFIRQRACDDIDVDDVAAGTALSRRTMERRFGQLLGRTPREEIVRVRIQRAKQLLTDTNWSVDQVAGKAGFQHSSYMSMLFKKQTGLTPGQYRRQAQS